MTLPITKFPIRDLALLSRADVSGAFSDSFHRHVDIRARVIEIANHMAAGEGMIADALLDALTAEVGDLSNEDEIKAAERRAEDAEGARDAAQMDAATAKEDQEIAEKAAAKLDVEVDTLREGIGKVKADLDAWAGRTGNLDPEIDAFAEALAAL